MSDVLFWVMSLFGALMYFAGMIVVSNAVMETPQWVSLVIVRKKTAITLIVVFVILWPLAALLYLIDKRRSR